MVKRKKEAKAREGGLKTSFIAKAPTPAISPIRGRVSRGESTKGKKEIKNTQRETKEPSRI